MNTRPSPKPKGARRIITFGTFDLFHIGHVNILKRARELGDELVVGVSTDALNFEKKGRRPVFDQAQRLGIVSSIRFVDHVFLEESLELKEAYAKAWEADCLVMGHDWAGAFDWLQPTCEVVYLPRTESVSSTAIKESIRDLLE